MNRELKDNFALFSTKVMNEEYFPIPKQYKGKPCFFPVHEVPERKRHLTLTKNGLWYDYTEKKEFQTFDEWMANCGCDHIAQVKFGFHKFDGRETSIPVTQLLDITDKDSMQEPEPEAQPERQMRSIIIHIQNLTINF